MPDSDIRATAEYDAAAALINLAAWDRASGVLEQFRRDYPDSEFADDVTQKLAVTYLSSGRSVEAAQEFERISVAAASTEDVRREALWKAADLYKESGTINSEHRVLEDIIARYPNPLSESIEARYRLLEIARSSGDAATVTTRLEELVQVDALAGAQRSDQNTLPGRSILARVSGACSASIYCFQVKSAAGRESQDQAFAHGRRYCCIYIRCRLWRCGSHYGSNLQARRGL